MFENAMFDILMTRDHVFVSEGHSTTLYMYTLQ